MSEGNYFDDLETRDPERRERDLFTQLTSLIEHARKYTTAYGRLLAEFESHTVRDRYSLARLPLTRKSELSSWQSEEPPFGGLVASSREGLKKVFASPGPIYEPESGRYNYWRMARALYAAGFRRGQMIHNTFSYHLTPAGSMLESGAFALGCAVIPGGVGQTEQQVEAIAAIRPDGYVGTPSFLKILLDRAEELGKDITSIKRALVSGEALPNSLRTEMEGRNVVVSQSYATADLGLIAYESEAREGMIIDEEIIVEIVRPGSGDPLPDGEVGEVVVTTLNQDYPLIRFATGDLSAIMDGMSPCGRTNKRIKGWMGRADQTTKVRGMFIRPEQVNAVVARHPEIRAFRMVVSSQDAQDVLTFRVHSSCADDDMRAALENTVRDLCKLRADIDFVPAHELPNDGKVIDDTRTFD